MCIQVLQEQAISACQEMPRRKKASKGKQAHMHKTKKTSTVFNALELPHESKQTQNMCSFPSSYYRKKALGEWILQHIVTESMKNQHFILEKTIDVTDS